MHIFCYQCCSVAAVTAISPQSIKTNLSLATVAFDHIRGNIHKILGVKDA